MKAYADMWKNYATFSGRTGVADYWLAVLVNLVVVAVTYVPVLVTKETLLIILPVAYALAMLIPGLALVWRRLHDSGRSGGWYFIALVPLVGGIWLLVLLCLSGNPGPNKYGPDPKQPAPQYAPA